MATHNVVLGSLACSRPASYRMPDHTNINPPAQHDRHHDIPNGISRLPAYQPTSLPAYQPTSISASLGRILLLYTISTLRCASAFTTNSSHHARTP
jgi:hypothetical protein